MQKDKDLIKRNFTLGGKKSAFFPSIGLKVTGKCRFNCPFCCEPSRTLPLFPIEYFIAITDTLYRNGTQRLCYTGGDPLLYPDIGQLLKHTKKLGFYNLLLTTDGALLKKRKKNVLSFLSAVRFSIHGINSQHDKIVGCPGAFKETEEVLDILAKANIPYDIVTVVTVLNIKFVPIIAEWCHQRGAKRYYLFGLMRSGRGDNFIKQHGEVSRADISTTVASLKEIYSREQLDIIYYDYSKNAECILIYGDGRVLVDPYPTPPSFQLDIGNILSESPTQILERFYQDPKNYEGYCKHLKRTNGLLT